MQRQKWSLFPQRHTFEFKDSYLISNPKLSCVCVLPQNWLTKENDLDTPGGDDYDAWWFDDGVRKTEEEAAKCCLGGENNDDDDDDEYEAWLAELAKTISGKNRNAGERDVGGAVCHAAGVGWSCGSFWTTRTRYTWLGRKEKGRRARSRKAFCSKTRSKTSVCLRAHISWTFENGFG